ncbi:MAG: glycosyltransferase family 2 protein [Anaerotruncus sp.]|nr:glycosyltransferase family 2 protein [Anaerotruncus sp.]
MISVIVPIYNVEKHLKKCINSITGQTNRNIEIILVNDGSPDGCLEICNEFAKKDSRIKVINKENGGLVSARKAGLAAASGEYIAFVDGDDYLKPTAMEIIETAIEKYSPDMVLFEFLSILPSGEIKSDQNFFAEYARKAELSKKLYPTMLYDGRFYNFGIMPSCWSKVFKKELLEKELANVDNSVKMGEDAAFTYPCLLDAKSVCMTDEPLYCYNIRPESMSNAYDKNLESIILLPYFRLKEKSRETGGVLDSQLDYYLIYLINFLIRNEARSKNPKPAIKRIAKNEEICAAAKRLSMAQLPMHTRLLAYALRKQNSKLLLLYMKALKIFM